MREDIKSLKLCGGKFSNEVTLPLYVTNSNKTPKVFCSLIYGRNGSGKSTIARALRKIAKSQDDSISSVAFCDERGTEVQLNEDEKGKIYVFDQRFIEENIKIEADGLNTIVMLGGQVELDKKIAAERAVFDDTKTSLDEKLELLKRFNNNKDKISPSYYKYRIDESLKHDNSWSDRDRLLTETKYNTPVNSDTFKLFVDVIPKAPRDKLLIEFDKKYNDLLALRRGDKKITAFVPEINVNDYPEENILALLRKRIERPVLGDRDKLLLDTFLSRGDDFLRDIRVTFSKNEVENCPFCARSITKAEKEGIIDSIENVLNDYVKEHQNLLSRNRLTEIKIDLMPFSELLQYKAACELGLNNVNSIIVEYNRYINNKIDNPYQVKLYRNYHLKEALLGLNHCLNELRKAVNAHNKQLEDEIPLVAELRSINSMIAHYDIEPYCDSYFEQLQEKSKLEDNVNALNAELEVSKGRLYDLTDKKKNTKIALDVINKSLSYIFFSKSRMRLESVSGKYQLTVNGSPVKPRNISTGETNAIALCYFFSMIGENKSINDVNKENYLIAIDDPITSFDKENKVGMLSFIKYEIKQFALGCPLTKFLVMTHDMMTFTHMELLLDGIADKVNKPLSNDKVCCNKYVLKDQCIVKWEKYNNEYSNLFKATYEYATASKEMVDMPIGNTMRQLLEAFGTFQYKLGIDNITTDDTVLGLLPKEYREHFDNLMCRLILNGESHRQYEVRFNMDMKFEQMYSFDEKQRTAREVLCFMYLLNKQHVLTHIYQSGNSAATNEKIKEKLKEWCEQIKQGTL